MRRVIETAVILMGTLGWWGFVYPELCLTGETCREEEALGDAFEPVSGRELEEFLGRGGKFRIKSKVIEYLYQEKEKGFEE